MQPSSPYDNSSPITLSPSKTSPSAAYPSSQRRTFANLGVSMPRLPQAMEDASRRREEELRRAHPDSLTERTYARASVADLAPLQISGHYSSHPHSTLSHHSAGHQRRASTQDVYDTTMKSPASSIEPYSAPPLSFPHVERRSSAPRIDDISPVRPPGTETFMQQFQVRLNGPTTLRNSSTFPYGGPAGVRASVACDACRKRKVKCTVMPSSSSSSEEGGGGPRICVRCGRLGLSCIWKDDKSKKLRSSGSMASISDFVIEDLVAGKQSVGSKKSKRLSPVSDTSSPTQSSSGAGTPVQSSRTYPGSSPTTSPISPPMEGSYHVPYFNPPQTPYAHPSHNGHRFSAPSMSMDGTFTGIDSIAAYRRGSTGSNIPPDYITHQTFQSYDVPDPYGYGTNGAFGTDPYPLQYSQYQQQQSPHPNMAPPYPEYTGYQQQ